MRDENYSKTIVYMQLKVSLKSGIFIKLYIHARHSLIYCNYTFSNNCKKALKNKTKARLINWQR